MSDLLTVTATEANRSFSKLLRAVGEGKRVRITSHGRTVAQLSGHEESEDERRARKLAAWEKLSKRLRSQERVVIGPWTRAELYERD